MKKDQTVSRRLLVKSSLLGLVAGAVSKAGYSSDSLFTLPGNRLLQGLPHERYPAIELSVASEVVGVSHFNLNRLKELVDPRPELAKASWDWGFGDWETAIDAATHVGRKDIVEYLVSKGALPTLFTFAFLGEMETVKSMISQYPGIQKNTGPHGITLLQHARTGLESKDIDNAKARQLVDYLEGLGDADGKKYLDISEEEKPKFLGDYKFGNGKEDGFTIKLNMRKMLSLGKLGKSGGALYRIAANEFTYQGAPSVRIKFILENNKVVSLILNEPGLVLTAKKI